MIRERFGVRPDGRPITEVTTYIPAEADHPLAVELAGEEGTWVKLSVGNSLAAMGAKEVSKAEFQEAVAEADLLHEAVLQEIADRQERVRREIEAKQDLIRRELLDLGLSFDAVNAIIRQVKG
jgi:hypothetical protein